MEEYVSCTFKELAAGDLLVSDVALPEGELSSVFLGPGGVCAVTQEETNLPALYQALRALLGTVRVSLYLGHSGRYDPYQHAVTPLPGGAAESSREIRDYLRQEPSVNTQDKIQLMQEKLFYADARTRGYYRDTDGTLYLLRGERFRPVSELDPEQQYRLTLFGGFLGLHRFAAGKCLSGLLYLLTCGLFLAGWLVDVLQMFLGIQKDRDKSLILPPADRRKKLVLVLPALVLGAIAMVIYLNLAGRALDIGGDITLPEGLLRAVSTLLGN